MEAAFLQQAPTDLPSGPHDTPESTAPAAIPALAPVPPKPARDAGPIPMSFPAILRTAGLTDRFAHLRISSSTSASVPVTPKKNRRDDKEGKRWVRRKDNGKLNLNVDIAL